MLSRRSARQRPCVLVLGAYQQTITIVRSLARAGYAVIVGREGARRTSIDLSRCVSEVWRHPQTTDAAALGLALIAFVESRPEIRYVFPVGELELEALIALRSRLPGGVTVVMPEADAARLCLDKARTGALAAELGIPLPPTRLVRPDADLAAASAQVGFPMVIKRTNSFALLGGEKAVICCDLTALASWGPVVAAEAAPVLLQGYVHGARHNCQFAAVGGEIVAYFQQKVLRTDRANGTGYGVEGVSVAPRDDLRGYCEALLRRLRYTGVGCVQFLVANDSPGVAFLECNPRLDATCDLPYRCGLDFPLLALHCAVPVGAGASQPAVPRRYAEGRRFYAPFRDLQGVRARVLAGTGGPREIARALLAWCASASRFDSHQLGWSWRDPMPSAYLGWEAVRSVLRSGDAARGGRAGSSGPLSPSPRRAH